MDVLIKGMKIPKSCEECWMTYEGDSDNCPVVNESVVKYMVEEKKHPACPLVKVPPHGDLVDRDYIEANGLSLNDAPVILEASK